MKRTEIIRKIKAWAEHSLVKGDREKCLYIRVAHVGSSLEMYLYAPTNYVSVYYRAPQEEGFKMVVSHDSAWRDDGIESCISSGLYKMLYNENGGLTLSTEVRPYSELQPLIPTKQS